jgi:hypothetical protein
MREKLPNAEKCKFVHTKAGGAHLTATDAESVSYQSNV